MICNSNYKYVLFTFWLILRSIIIVKETNVKDLN